MTANARIGLNVVASYGRSLVALACGLLAGRWALMALGAVDFGLYGLVAGIAGFIAFLNNVLSLAVGRFFAFEVGKGREVQAWFSTAVSLHVVVAVGLIAVGWPIGEWAVRCALTIPTERVGACVNVFRLACLACFVGMVTVPFSAMYTAKQKIAELTVYDIVANISKTMGLYWMASCPGEWLTGYAVLLAAVAVAPSLLIAGRAMRIFPECRIIRDELMDRGRIAALLKYASWECFGSGAVVLKNSGGAILVNEYIGASYNCSMSYSNSVALHTSALSNGLTGAFYPAITNAYGAGDLNRARSLAFGACTYGGLLALLFAVPMALEADYVFALWLKTPPPGVSTLCIYVLAATFLERITSGCGLAINASGRIAWYQFWSGLGLMLAFPLMWIGLGCGVSGEGGGVWSVHVIGLASVVAYVINGVAKLWFAQRIVGMGVRTWIWRVAVPVSLTAALAVVVGGACVRSLPMSFARVLCTGMSSVVVVGGVACVLWRRRQMV